MATARAVRPTRHFQLALYLVAGLILVDQLSQLVVAILPPHLERVNWRYASVTVAVGYTATLLLADLLIIAAATGLGHRTFLRFWALLHILAAAALATVTPLFLLDALEMRALVQVGQRAAIMATSVRVAVVAVLAFGICIFTAVFLWRTTRRRGAEHSAPLVTGLTAERSAET